MSPRGRGSILFTGATASVRGGAGFSAFAGAKNGLRALAQSLARELGPKGIHVAHVVVDGAIDGAFTRQREPDAAARLEREEILDPREIAAQLRLAAPAAPQRLDVRTGPAALVRTLVRPMTKRLEFLFDFASLNAYLAYRALPPILQRTGAELVITPCLLGGLFKADRQPGAVRRLRRRQGQARLRDAGNPPLRRAPRADQIQHEPAFPGQHADSDARPRGGARGAAWLPPISKWGCRACGRRASSSTIPHVLARRIAAAGLDAEQLFADAQRPEVKQSLADSPQPPPSAAPSACRPSSSARKCFSVRSGWGRSRRNWRGWRHKAGLPPVLARGEPYGLDTSAAPGRMASPRVDRKGDFPARQPFSCNCPGTTLPSGSSRRPRPAAARR